MGIVDFLYLDHQFSRKAIVNAGLVAVIFAVFLCAVFGVVKYVAFKFNSLFRQHEFRFFVKLFV